ncbi:hypothetical protein, partial [Acinetobacter parvus]|uniref:hypothetical protein n=1 Tax=Acinetobacter parvus TaxID=134533 RepID=UPI002FDF5C52
LRSRISLIGVVQIYGSISISCCIGCVSISTLAAHTKELFNPILTATQPYKKFSLIKGIEIPYGPEI